MISLSLYIYIYILCYIDVCIYIYIYIHTRISLSLSLSIYIYTYIITYSMIVYYIISYHIMLYVYMYACILHDIISYHSTYTIISYHMFWNIGLGTANLHAKILDFGGFVSSRTSILRGGIPRPIRNFLESLSHAILAGTILGRSGVYGIVGYILRPGGERGELGGGNLRREFGCVCVSSFVDNMYISLYLSIYIYIYISYT